MITFYGDGQRENVIHFCEKLESIAWGDVALDCIIFLLQSAHVTASTHCKYVSASLPHAQCSHTNTSLTWENEDQQLCLLHPGNRNIQNISPPHRKKLIDIKFEITSNLTSTFTYFTSFIYDRSNSNVFISSKTYQTVSVLWSLRQRLHSILW